MVTSSIPVSIVKLSKGALARVIPISKKGSRAGLSNYRPISLLSIFKKLSGIVYVRDYLIF